MNLEQAAAFELALDACERSVAAGADPIDALAELVDRIDRLDFSAGRAPTDTPPCFSLPPADQRRFSRDEHDA